MINWSGNPQPEPSDVRAAIDERSLELRAHGLHSMVFLPDEGVCAAIMVASCENAADAGALGASILPDAAMRIESMPFDDDGGMPARLQRRDAPPSADVALRRLQGALTVR